MFYCRFYIYMGRTFLLQLQFLVLDHSDGLGENKIFLTLLNRQSAALNSTESQSVKNLNTNPSNISIDEIFKLYRQINHLVQLGAKHRGLASDERGGGGERAVLRRGRRLPGHRHHQRARRERLARVVERLARVYTCNDEDVIK